MLIKGIALFFLGIGVFVLMQVISPVIAFKIWELSNFDQSQLLANPKPAILSGNLAVGEDQVPGQVLGISVESINNFPAFISKRSSLLPPPYKEFKVTIPKLTLYDVKTLVYSNDFEESLSHLPGTALPGEKGNVFITGHSSILATLTSKQKAYFANLPSLKKGDDVLVEALGQRYTYQVLGLRVVDPKDISVITPPDDSGRYLTLMTCVPPGFNSKRLIVLAKLRS